jgi:hypothetical protein
MTDKKCVHQNRVRNNKEALPTRKMTHNKNFQPMKKHVGPHKNNFRPMKNQYGQILTNHDYSPTQKCCKSATKHYKPIKNHAWHNTVPEYTVAQRGQPRNVANTRRSTSHAQRSQRSKKCNQEINERADTDDRYLSHLKSLTDQQHKQNIMKTPSIMKKQRNPVSKTTKSPYKSTRVQYLTPALLEQSNIKLLIGEQRIRHEAKLRKHDAMVVVEKQFFTALRNLYTWPMNSLILANIQEVQEFWELHLTKARNCSYKAETIDPNGGVLRYDIMFEIVNLESIRIGDFMNTFQKYHRTVQQDGDITDHSRCDNEMLAHFDTIQANVILDIAPLWVMESRRPPLTWYTFLSPSKFAFAPYRTEEDVLNERILAPEYYDSSGSNST